MSFVDYELFKFLELYKSFFISPSFLLDGDLSLSLLFIAALAAADDFIVDILNANICFKLLSKIDSVFALPSLMFASLILSWRLIIFCLRLNTLNSNSYVLLEIFELSSITSIAASSAGIINDDEIAVALSYKTGRT
jgi:hypothetical protein